MDVQADRGLSLREVMGAYPTGVTVVGGSDADGVPFGLTVNSFTSVSLDPPLVLVCIGHGSTWHDELAKAQCFAVSVLAADQQETAVRFAQEPSKGRFDDVPWTRGENGSPILRGVVAWMECAVRTVIDGGDHSILIGQIDRSGVSDRPALLFHRGRLGSSDGGWSSSEGALAT